ncbi:hypothetical protein ABKN59_010646 [Abortiporus biennis]
MSASQTILNPETPLAWVSKSVAQQVEIVRYVFVGTLAAWIWDYLMSIWDEYRIFRKSGIKAIDVVYLLARFTTFSHIITALLFITAPIEHCHAMEIASAWVAFLAMPLNTLLYIIWSLLRSRAEVEHRRPISELRFQTRTPATSECPSDDTILAGKLAVVSASACPPLYSGSEHCDNRIGLASSRHDHREPSGTGKCQPTKTRQRGYSV